MWVTLKTLFFPIIIVEMVWFWRRLSLIARPPSLLEKMLMSLGAALTFLNLPIEYATLGFEMPWVNLFNDVKQGIFYANLLVFWLIFAGEHLIGNDHDIDHFKTRDGLITFKTSYRRGRWSRGGEWLDQLLEELGSCALWLPLPLCLRHVRERSSAPGWFSI